MAYLLLILLQCTVISIDVVHWERDKVESADFEEDEAKISAKKLTPEQVRGLDRILITKLADS